MDKRDSKRKELELKTLPNEDQYEGFVKDLLREGKIAELRTERTPIELGDGNTENIFWEGTLDSVLFLGYPFLGKDEVRDGNNRLISRTPKPMNIGIPLIPLYWDKDKNCFACVRGDVYEK